VEEAMISAIEEKI